MERGSSGTREWKQAVLAAQAMTPAWTESRSGHLTPQVAGRIALAGTSSKYFLASLSALALYLPLPLISPPSLLFCNTGYHSQLLGVYGPP